MFPNILARLGKEPGRSDRYILNQVNSVWVNVIAGYPFYILPIFFPDLIWLGLAPIMFNLAQLILHGFAAPAATKSAYNPGLLTCLPWLVLSIWYSIDVASNDLATGTEWGITVGYLLAWMILALPVGTFILLSDRDSTYPFAPEELARFDKYVRHIRTVIHP